jgi:hypothetical protein
VLPSAALRLSGSDTKRKTRKDAKQNRKTENPCFIHHCGVLIYRALLATNVRIFIDSSQEQRSRNGVIGFAIDSSCLGGSVARGGVFARCNFLHWHLGFSFEDQC